MAPGEMGGWTGRGPGAGKVGGVGGLHPGEGLGVGVGAQSRGPIEEVRGYCFPKRTRKSMVSVKAGAA